MCGITGYISKSTPDFDESIVLKNMTDSLIHRGPDDSGNAIFQLDNRLPSVGLGHRRLSILDLSVNSKQPFFSEDRKVIITFNGEIYNYLELKEDLQNIGYKFNTTSDTEVFLKGYMEWGTDCFCKFNGMWSCAIYDKNIKSVILSRDRLGKKPLYYYKGNDIIVFASEIKALL